jgi:hypothetical protein
MRDYVEFHNPGPGDRVSDLVFDLRRLPAEVRVLFRTSKLDTVRPLQDSLVGVATVHHPDRDDSDENVILEGVEEATELLGGLRRWLDRVEDQIEGEDDDGEGTKSARKPPPARMEPPVYRAQPSSLVGVKDVRLPVHGMAAALLSIEVGRDLPKGAEYSFDILQLVEGRPVGGSTFVIRVGGTRRFPPPPAPPLPPPGDDGPPRHVGDVPPWMRDLVEEREEILGLFRPEPFRPDRG